jgi:cytochrome P450
VRILRNKLKQSVKLIYRAAKKLTKKTVPTFDKLVFCFGGRSEGWPTLGRSLYHTYDDFRQSICDCNRILIENGGSEILSYFEDPVNINYFDDESKFTCITAIQIATTILYGTKGYFPNVVFGVSMGEPVAAFAAGALSKEEALKVALSFMSIYKAEKASYNFLFVNAPYSEAELLCKALPVWTEIVYEDSLEAVIIACDKDDTQLLMDNLSDKNITFKLVSNKYYVPYHTTLIKKQNSLLKNFYKDFEARPLKCDYYSPTLGTLIPKHTILEPNYWYQVACTPVLIARTLHQVIEDQYKTFLMIGPPAISKRQFSNITGFSEFKILNTFEYESDEVAHYHTIIKKLNKIKFEKSLLHESDTEIIFNNFKSSFDISSASYLQYEYLRKAGPIHFLPKHNSWLILNYDDVDFVLKQHEKFSSSKLKSVDPILLGGDPEPHEVTRNLLRPLFSSAVIAHLSDFATIAGERILTKLCEQESFDIVKDFSNPLSLYLLCDFFGMSAEDADRLLNITGIDYNDLTYWERLSAYFEDQFITCKLISDDRFWGKLRSMVGNEQFTKVDAIDLLKVIWTGGLVTTSELITAAMFTLLSEPSIAEDLSANEKLTSKFIEECLRLQTPLTAVQRLTTEPVEVAGQQLEAGVVVILHLRSAMVDPQYFSNPEAVSISRSAKRNLAFGAGIHQCIGMGIARAEATSTLNVVLNKMDQLKEYNLSASTHLKVAEMHTTTSILLTKKNS